MIYYDDNLQDMTEMHSVLAGMQTAMLSGYVVQTDKMVLSAFCCPNCQNCHLCCANCIMCVVKTPLFLLCELESLIQCMILCCANCAFKFSAL